MNELFNLKNKKTLRSKLRNNMPLAEIILWSKIKNRQINNTKFRRQFGIGRYVVDFYCPKLKLAIEVDGEIHSLPQNIEYDIVRQKYIEKFNISFLRFSNYEIYTNLDGVMHTIFRATIDHPQPPLAADPSLAGGENPANHPPLKGEVARTQ